MAAAAVEAPVPLPVVDGPADQPAVAPKEREDLSNEPIDESMLIRIKGKVRRPTRPDDAERNAQVQLLQDEIVKLITRQKQIKDLLDNKHSGNKGGSLEQQKLREQLQQLRTEWDTVLRGKQRLQAEDGDKRTEREKLLSELRAIRDGARGPSSLEALEAKIAELEFKLTHESMSAAEEKRLREQKERMEQKERPNAVRAAALSTRLDALKAESNTLRGQVAEIDKQLTAIKAKREAVTAELDNLRAKETEARGDVPTLIAERKEASEVITELRKKQGEIRDAFNVQWQEFKKQERAWRVWAAHERVARQEQRKKEYEERQAARSAAEKANKPNKYEQQIFECEQAIAYLRSLTAGSTAASGPAASAAPEEPAPGMKLLKKKGDDELESWMTGTGKKGKNAKREAARAASAATAASAVKKLALCMDDLKLYMKLGVKAPATTADIPTALDALEAKKTDFTTKRDRAAAAVEASEESEAAVVSLSEDESEAEEEAPKDPVAVAAEKRGPVFDEEDPALGTAAPASAKGVWGARVAAAAVAGTA